MTDTIAAFARKAYVGVQAYYDRPGDDFDALPEEERRQWESAAVHALESTVDQIITAGRPVWWTTP